MCVLIAVMYFTVDRVALQLIKLTHFCACLIFESYKLQCECDMMFHLMYRLSFQGLIYQVFYVTQLDASCVVPM